MKCVLFSNEMISQITVSPVTVTLLSPYTQMLSLFLNLKMGYFEALGSYFTGIDMFRNKQVFKFSSLYTNVIVSIVYVLCNEHL